MFVSFRGFDESTPWIFKVGRFWFVSPFPSSASLSLINIPMLCLLLVDLGPLPLLRLK